jgi:hypothetical protein
MIWRPTQRNIDTEDLHSDKTEGDELKRKSFGFYPPLVLIPSRSTPTP